MSRQNLSDARLLAEQFNDLAERFQRAESRDDVDKAAAWGGRLLQRATKAGLYRWPTESGDLAEQDWPKPSLAPTAAENEAWRNIWYVALMWLPKDHGDSIPTFTYEQTEPGFFKAKVHWRELAENSAAAARYVSVTYANGVRGPSEGGADGGGALPGADVAHLAEKTSTPSPGYDGGDPLSLARQFVETGRRYLFPLILKSEMTPTQFEYRQAGIRGELKGIVKNLAPILEASGFDSGPLWDLYGNDFPMNPESTWDACWTVCKRLESKLLGKETVHTQISGDATQGDHEAEKTTQEGDDVKAPDKPKTRRRRRKGHKEPRPLTSKQAEAVQIVGECKGNIAEAARRLGKDYSTVAEHYNAAMKKLGKGAVKPKTKRLSTDRRGQENLSPDDDRRG